MDDAIRSTSTPLSPTPPSSWRGYHLIAGLFGSSITFARNPVIHLGREMQLYDSKVSCARAQRSAPARA